MVELEPIYLGDGAYATFTGNELYLTTGHHDPTFAQHVLVLGFDEIALLKLYLDKINAEKKD